LLLAQNSPWFGRNLAQVVADDESCVRLRPACRNPLWSHDFVMDCTEDGLPFRMLTVIDEFRRERLVIGKERRKEARGLAE